MLGGDRGTPLRQPVQGQDAAGGASVRSTARLAVPGRSRLGASLERDLTAGRGTRRPRVS